MGAGVRGLAAAALSGLHGVDDDQDEEEDGEDAADDDRDQWLLRDMFWNEIYNLRWEQVELEITEDYHL